MLKENVMQNGQTPKTDIKTDSETTDLQKGPQQQQK